MTPIAKASTAESSSDNLPPLESILCTEELNRRPPRMPDFQSENRVLTRLAQALADSPRSILQILADSILDFLHAHSAGVSLLTTHDGGKRFYWPAIAGLWKPYIGGGTPRDFGPCGDVLDRNCSLLFRHLERRYTYFPPPINECLLVPFYVEGKAVGTIWALAHDDRRKFDAEDLRQLESLGRFASAAYQAMTLLETLEQQNEALRHHETELIRHVSELQRANAVAEEARRAALKLMDEVVQSKQQADTLDVQLRLEINEKLALREEIAQISMSEEIVGASRALRDVLAGVAKVAPTDSTVLLLGETGTGKELIARVIHKQSQRSSRSFVSVNCAAIPRDLVASELFGHEKGAFTGATQRRLGRFELAAGGTIFLDEIGDLPLETQVVLLRVLQDHQFERVGGTEPIRVDVRVIAATNRDLQAAIAAGFFRSDLFYRLNVFPLEMPPLRERKEDIPLLIEYFIDRFRRRAGKSIRRVNSKSLRLLRDYPWPGNVRELQNIVERSVIVCDSEELLVDEKWLSPQRAPSEPEPQPQLSEKLASQEKEMIEAALRESRGRVFGPLGAAAKLGIPRSTLESKIRSLKINKHRFKGPTPESSGHLYGHSPNGE